MNIRHLLRSETGRVLWVGGVSLIMVLGGLTSGCKGEDPTVDAAPPPSANAIAPPPATNKPAPPPEIAASRASSSGAGGGQSAPAPAPN